MTRINVVPPSELTREHLVAEYREIVRVFALVRNAQNKGINKFNFRQKYKQPTEYTLGTGHVLFFYDKLQYILKRYHSLIEEMIVRGYSPNPISTSELCEGINKEWFGDYIPTVKALQINRERIEKRLSGDKT